MIELNWTFWVQAVNFVVTLLFLNHFIFKPILAHMEKREEETKALRDEAEGLRKKGDGALAEYENGVARIRGEAAEAVSSARAVAQEEMTARLAQSKKDFDAEIEKARAGVRAELEAASAALRPEIDRFARSMAGKILGRGV